MKYTQASLVTAIDTVLPEVYEMKMTMPKMLQCVAEDFFIKSLSDEGLLSNETEKFAVKR